MRGWLTVFMVASFAFGTAFADSLPANQLPMYGERTQSAKLNSADAAFIAAIEQQGISRQEGAKQIVDKAWSYWGKGDHVNAIKRFNQAWLLDPENGNAYHGFAVIVSMRGGAPSETERFFQLAISKPDISPVAFVNYGRFLWTQKRLDESMAQLNRALSLSPMVHNARANIAFVYYLKGDAGNACDWARKAQKNGDEQEKGFLEDMCRLAKQ